MNRIARRDCLARVGVTVFSLSLTPLVAEELSGDLYVDDEIDRAIDKGIEALIKHQRDDGAIADNSHATAMSALAIMALASVGTVPDDSTPRGIAMNRAIEFVLMERNQHATGYFGERDGSRMYGHGIVTLMLTEILGMGVSPEQNARIHDALDKALRVILQSQAVKKPAKLQGGWRYTPTSGDSDLSVSVWQVMALRSAKNDDLDVPMQAIESAIAYLRNSYASPVMANGMPRDEVSGFAYTPGTHHPTFTMTAAGLLAMQTCGQYDTPMVLGASRWLLEHPPRTKDRFFFYGMYYYAQGMHQVGGEAAATAQKTTAEMMLQLQTAAGHWMSAQGEERNIGIVYATSLAILSLSVRYHYLPIYQR